MKTISIALALLVALAIATPAGAELRHVQIKTLGMD
jgi:hypothetical protein